MSTVPSLSFSTSNKRKPILICDGFIFQLNRTRSKLKYWRCKDRTCSAYIHTNHNNQYVGKSGDHNFHLPVPEQVEVAMFKEKVKERVVKETTAIGNIYDKEMASLNLSDGALGLIPLADDAKASLNRLRRQTTPPLPTSSCFDVPDAYSTTISGAHFLFSDKVVRKKRVLLFATDEQLRMLFSAKTIMIDGTFSACVPHFNQVFSLHCIKYGYNFPCVIGTGEAKVLQECELIVWDECTMAHRYALEALNHTLQDLRNNGKNMGGVVVLIAGDFRQTLPVIPKGTMADELKACLKSSYLWRHVVPLKLSTNMRVHLRDDVSAGRFAEQLLAIGNGKIPADPVSGLINISDNFCNIVESVEELKNKVFPNIQTQYKDHKWLCERAILAPKNVNVNAINLQIQQQLPGEAISYKSIDTVKDIDMVVQYPTEFLNSLEPSGMPPHNLRLKIGSSIMLLRNLDAPRLCNGTRLCVKTLMPHVIEATIMTGCAKGEDVFIPKIPLLPSDIPFEFTRLQFPVRLAFAMSINKAQGQSLKVAGVNLETPCFSHGQLYVACSRVGTGENLYVFAPDGKTKNIVYKTALQ
ncbi:unnamed protein product [Rotaria sp. Silwood1]|nr:unnamed protein product [Rotaria sp. Silwood1]